MFLHLQEHHGSSLSQMNMQSVCDMLSKVDGISQQLLPRYQQSIQENNITGRVLLTCNLDELGKVLDMKFGDWQLFRAAILALREEEYRNEFSENQSFVEQQRGSRKSVHIKSTPSANSTFSFDGQGSPHSRMPELSRQLSADGSVSDQIIQSDYAESVPQFDPIEEEEEGTPPQPRMKREDSVVYQLQYETGLLREALESFTESNLEGDEESSCDENDEILENEHRRGLPVQFSISSNYGDISLKSEPISPTSCRSFRLSESSSNLPDNTIEDCAPLLAKTSPRTSVSHERSMLAKSSSAIGGLQDNEDQPWIEEKEILSDSLSVVDESADGSSKSLEESIMDFMKNTGHKSPETSFQLRDLHNPEDSV